MFWIIYNLLCLRMTWMNEDLYRRLSIWLSALFPLLQLVSIITDETPIEQMRNRLMIKDRGSSASSPSSSTTHSSQLPHPPPHTRKPKLALLREVFGRGWHIINHTHRKQSSSVVLQIFPCQTTLSSPSGSVFCWLLPLHSNPPSVGGISYSALPDYDVWLWKMNFKVRRMKSCVFMWVTIRAWIFSVQVWHLILWPERWRGKKENTGVNVNFQWTDRFFFSPLILCLRQMSSYLKDLWFLNILTYLKCLPGVWL